MLVLKCSITYAVLLYLAVLEDVVVLSGGVDEVVIGDLVQQLAVVLLRAPAHLPYYSVHLAQIYVLDFYRIGENCLNISSRDIACWIMGKIPACPFPYC